MATTVRALAKFTNDRYLSHLDGNTIETGATVEVADHYAQKLRKRGLVEIVEDEEADEAEPQTETEQVASATEEEGEWSLGESVGAGYYYALFAGKRVENEETTSGLDTVGKGKEEAQAEIDRRNEEGVLPSDIPEA